MTVAVNNLSASRGFQTRYRDLLAHYGVSGQRINARQAHGLVKSNRLGSNPLDSLELVARQSATASITVRGT